MSRKKILKLEDLKNFTPISVGDRINYIIADNQMTGAAFCKIMKISSGNLNGLINDDSKPSTSFNVRILERFSVNINWLLTGKGEKYINEGDEGVREDVPIYNKVGMPLDDDPIVAELLEGARRVLKSGNQVAFDALERNIRYFAHAVEMEKRMTTMESDLAAIKEKQERWEKACSDKVPPAAEDPAIKKAM